MLKVGSYVTIQPDPDYTSVWIDSAHIQLNGIDTDLQDLPFTIYKVLSLKTYDLESPSALIMPIGYNLNEDTILSEDNTNVEIKHLKEVQLITKQKIE